MNETPNTASPYLRMFAIVYLVGLGTGAYLNATSQVPAWYELFTGCLVTVSTVAYVFVALSMISLYLSSQLDLIRASLPVNAANVLLAVINVALMLANQFVISAHIVAVCILLAYFVRIVLAPNPVGKNSG